jgi:hypothetical protein
MIPLKLTLEGIYSYQERQTIDFTALSQAGLFWYLRRGSGKSSILEAITYALFGETERLNARDKRAYNMMNLSLIDLISSLILSILKTVHLELPANLNAIPKISMM